MKSKLYIILVLALFVIPIFSAIIHPVKAESTTITIAVDLAHGERDKYLDYIIGNITQVSIDGKTYTINWIKIQSGETITSQLLSNVDILLIGQPTTSFTPEEMEAILNWLKTGNKALYVAGDSDYGGGPASIDAVNTLLEYIGAKLRLEHGAVYSDQNKTYTYKGVEYPTVAAAYYRMLAFVEPDNIPELYTSILDEGITKPILMHGPTVVIWIDETGKYRDPVRETFPGLIRIAWYHKSYIADNTPPSPYLYDPLDYGQGTGDWDFIAYAAEYWKDYNVVITVAGESLYGDYEPAWASTYYGVELDGPKFVTNLVKWWIKIITTPPAPPPLPRTLVLSFSDPEGDDNGTGELKYPTNAVFQPGVFDLLKFEVYTDEVNVYFKAYFKNLGDNPWGGPNGFCLQHLQVYVYTTMRATPNTTAPGLNVEIYPGWHYLIVGVPGWGDTPWPDGEVSAIYNTMGELLAKEGDLFDVYAIPEENAIEVKISKSLLLDVENIENWAFVVAVASYDGYGSYKVRGVVPGDPQEWSFGGADPLAAMAGVHPTIVDLLAPTKQDQYNMLKSYDATTKKLATVYALSKTGLITSPPTTTPITTPTITVEVTVTKTQTVEKTITQVQTVVETTTETKTETVTQPDMTTTGIVGVIAIIIGFIIGYIIKKK